MNDVLSINRLLLLLRKTIVEKPMQTSGTVGLLLILTLILYAVVNKLGGLDAAQNLSFIWGLPGGGVLLSAFGFSYFYSNASGYSYLSLPASFLEKWLCPVLIVGILYPILFLLFYQAIDILFVKAYHDALDPTHPFYKQQYDAINTFDINGIVAWKVYPMFLMLTGVMLTGGLYFNKNAFVKTAITFALGCLALVGLNWFIAILFFGPINDAFPFSSVSVTVESEQGTLLLPAPTAKIVGNILFYVLPAILWLLPLLRIREKEV